MKNVVFKLCNVIMSSSVFFRRSVPYLFLFFIPNVYSSTWWYDKEIASDYKKRWNIGVSHHGITPKDPYFWRYNTEFAKRYGMPIEWVSDSLTGVEAIAFRISTPFPDICNTSSSNDNKQCITPIECQLDLYLDKEVKLPRFIPGQFQGLISALPPHSPFYLYQHEKDEAIQYDQQKKYYQNLGSTVIHYASIDGSFSPTGIFSQYDKQRLKNVNVFKIIGCDAFMAKDPLDGIILQISPEPLKAESIKATVKNPYHVIAIDSKTSTNIVKLLSAYQDGKRFLKLGYQDYRALINNETKKSSKINAFNKDNSPYIWTYTKDFAQEHAMPKEWIDDKLKGVKAVAFRVFKPETETCVAKGGKQSCLDLPTCQLDFYLDKNSDIPWLNPGQLQGFHALPYLSQYYLRPQILEELPRYNPSYKSLNGGTPKNSIYAISSVYGTASSSTIGAIVYHDQFSLPTVDIVSVRGCFSIPQTKYLKTTNSFILNFLPAPANPHGPFVPIKNRVDWLKDIRHQVILNNEFIRRINRLRKPLTNVFK